MYAENIETIRQSETSEKEPYNYAKIQSKITAIQKQEVQEEPRKAPGQDLKPWNPMILQKFWYNSREEVKDWQ
jgi:hypothetical protein